MELVYPVSIAPLAAGNKGTREMLPVVQPTGTVVARASRAYCHAAKLLHPVVHLHIIDRFGRIYLQHRSAKKSIFPLYWDTAVGGHVGYGEYLKEALFREAGEELAFYDFNPVPLTSYVWDSAVEHELVSVYAAVGHFDLRPDGDEVIEGRWWEVSEIEESMGKSILTPNFEYEFGMIRKSLFSLL